MSDEPEINYGGVIAVDSEELRDVGRRLDGVAQTVGAAVEALQRANSSLLWSPGDSSQLDALTSLGSVGRVEQLSDDCADAAGDTLLMADAYELVELRVRQDSLTLSDAVEAFSIQRRIDGLIAANPRLEEKADSLVEAWESGRFEGLLGQFVGLTQLTAGLTGGIPQIAAWVGATGHGLIPAGTQLQGTADPVKVQVAGVSLPASPPGGVAEALRRIPENDDGRQIRVEKYTMPGGEQRFIAYVRGTQSAAYGGTDPFDIKSNLELYGGEKSASYQAVLDALKAAGAQAGDSVMAVGHSQGAMIGSYLALDGDYEVPVVVTAGSPVAPVLENDQQSIAVRHTDDIVSALAGGDLPVGTGSTESIVVTRQGDDGLNPIAPHLLESYAETAKLVDDSGDPRLVPFQAFMAELGEATSVEATEYRAIRG